ncbi:MAG TPA: hypothetical protein VIQ48_10990 [Rhodanobacter sp.]|jgi:hypothetical protein
MKCLSLLLCACALGACSAKPPPTEPKPPTPISTPFDTLRATEQRARDVQQVVNKAAAQQRQQIDAASQ